MENLLRESSNPYVAPALEATSVPPSFTGPFDPNFSPIHITYSLTFEEYFKAIQLATKNKKIFGLLGVLIVIGILCLGAFLKENTTDRILIFVMIPTCIGLYFLFKLLFRLQLKALWKKIGSNFDSVNMIISQKCLEIRTDLSNSQNSWESYTKFRVDDQMVVLFISGASNLIYAIPRKAFSDDRDWYRFAHFLHEKFPQ
jgi:hypothetical protein